jgi:hypothetical protein
MLNSHELLDRIYALVSETDAPIEVIGPVDQLHTLLTEALTYLEDPDPEKPLMSPEDLAAILNIEPIPGTVFYLACLHGFNSNILEHIGDERRIQYAASIIAVLNNPTPYL